MATDKKTTKKETKKEVKKEDKKEEAKKKTRPEQPKQPENLDPGLTAKEWSDKIKGKK